MTEVEQPSQNGIELTTEEDENNKARPADIEQDMREMERRKRVEAIMGSKLFREELERIVDSQIREGGASGILQQLSDIVGIPTTRVGNVFKSSNCVLPINDIRGVESMGYSKGEKILRCKLAATFRLLDLYGWTNGLGAQITARLKVDQELFLVNPYGLLYHEVTASSLNKVDMQANVIEQGTTNFGVNKNQFILHSVVHAARPDIRCAIYIGCNPVVAVSSLKVGLLPVTNDSVVLGEITTYQYTGSLSDAEEREKLVRNLGPVSKVILLSNHGALCCGETIEEAFFAANHIVQACETQLKLLPVGVDNLVLIPEESRKAIYDSARRPPEDLAAAFEKKAALAASASEDASTDKDESQTDNSKETSHKLLQQPKWRVGGAEFEALMRMLDNAGFRTGYIYRHPLIKSELPKPKNDVEVPPAVSSLGYLLEEEELYRQGIWKKGDWRKGGDRSRWLNSPNVYQKVEVLETGTPDPKKITKWVAEGSPTHSTPVRIEGALQFVPPGTNPKEFKKVQQQIKDNRRADKISAGPQSHILEGVTWDEANRIKDATVSSAGDHVVLMGAASKGIIQRGFQHNATVYKTPYAKNPFDNVTDDELNEYKRTVERKKNIHGEYTDTDFSESEALSSLQTSGAQQQNSSKTAVVSQSETEDASEHQVIRIETKQAPVPSQPEVVLSDATLDFLNGERQHTATNKTLPSPRAQETRTFKTPVKIITVDRSEQTDDQEKFTSIDFFSSLDGSYHQEFFNPMFADKFILSHAHLKDIMQQQNPNLKSPPNDVQYEMVPYKLEIQTSEIFPVEEDISEYYTPRICYSVMENEIQPTDNRHMHCKLVYSKSAPDFRSESNKSIDFEFRPYRTNSHFGFNYPILQKGPEHFHIPVAPSKYVPLKKSLSYNEIFSSPQYVDLCDNCFDQVLRFRPQLNCSNVPTESIQIEQKERMSYTNMMLDDYTNEDERNEEQEFAENFELLEAVRNWMDNEQLNVSRVLEPVIEVDEDQVSDDMPIVDVNSNVVGTEDSSSFLYKITRMNYSEESTNIGFQPSKTVTSEISVPIGSTTEDLAKEINGLSINKSPERNNVMLLPAEQPFSDDRTADVTSSTEATSSHSESNSARKLMTREERNQRKQEFNELWEDHIQYFTSMDSSGSDDDEMDVERNKSEIFFGESRVSNMSIANDEDEDSSDSEVSGTYRVTSQSSSEPVVNNANSTEFFSFVSTEPMASDSELNSMEQKIIEKIHVNRLKEQEAIFENIENAIRHKITPSKLERIVQNQRNDVANAKVIASTPELVSSMKSDSFYSLDMSSVENKSVTTEHRSRSLVSESRSRNHRLKQVPTYRDLSKLGQEESLSKENASSSADESPPEMPSRDFPECNNLMNSNKTYNHVFSPDREHLNLQSKRSKRNFVAENIVNASKPRQRQKANGYNAFKTSSSTPCLSSDNKTKQVPPVYSFQTKTVRGSPRFWVSLSPRNKEQKSQKKSLKSRSRSNRRNRRKEREVRFADHKQDIETVNLEVDTEKVNVELDIDVEPSRGTNLETEIKCLGNKIDSLNPRLTQYSKVINNYGERITKLSDILDVVVDTQNEIEESRVQLKGNIILGENVQNGDHSEAHLSTFSHSSKEDISTDGSPKKDKKKKKGLRTPSFLKKKKEKKKVEA